MTGTVAQPIPTPLREALVLAAALEAWRQELAAEALLVWWIIRPGYEELQKAAEESGVSHGLFGERERGWFYPDHLGSTSKVRDSATGTVTASYYEPFGKLYSTTINGVRQSFTGQQWDASAQLMYYNARFYDPALGRFIQTDPGIWSGEAKVNLSLAEKLNPYLYCNNNPVNFTDPTGYKKQKKQKKQESTSKPANSTDPNGLTASDNKTKLASAGLGALGVLGAGATTATKTSPIGLVLGFLSILTSGQGQSGVVATAAMLIPEGDKDKIAEHALEDDDGTRAADLGAETPEEVKDKISEVLLNPDTQRGTGVDKATGKPKTGYLAPDGTLVIHNPSAPGKGTIFVPTDPQGFFDKNFK